MILYAYSLEKPKTEFVHSGFFACMMAFLLTTTCPTKSHAIEIKPTEEKPTENNIMYRTSGRIYLPYGQNLLLSGNIYALKKYNILTAFAPSLEYNKRESITDFGVTGIIKWPLIEEKSWSLHLNGKLSGSQHYLGIAPQRNRWNFEHQIGWDANYHLADALQASFGIYHYRIINHFQYDNPTQSYINSNAGFASLRLSF